MVVRFDGEEKDEEEGEGEMEGWEEERHHNRILQKKNRNQYTSQI